MKLGIVGGGRAAWAFGEAWRRVGRPISGIALRSDNGIRQFLDVPQLELPKLAASSDVVLVAVGDRDLVEVAQRVAQLLKEDSFAFHPSGSHTSEVFAPHRQSFSLHPLRALPAPGERIDFANTLFTFEGDSSSRRVARDFVDEIGGRFEEIPREGKVRYHAAAVFASNYVEALLETSHQLIRDTGIGGDIRQDLATLARSAIDAWLRGEFTGPVARGDHGVVKQHIEALRDDPGRQQLYRLLASELAKALQVKGF
jgi:predicted short-subunit dehydrogenase-like oxidoreductase (DUF2520 family)